MEKHEWRWWGRPADRAVPEEETRPSLPAARLHRLAPFAPPFARQVRCHALVLAATPCKRVPDARGRRRLIVGRLTDALCYAA